MIEKIKTWWDKPPVAYKVVFRKRWNRRDYRYYVYRRTCFIFWKPVDWWWNEGEARNDVIRRVGIDRQGREITNRAGLIAKWDREGNICE